MKYKTLLLFIFAILALAAAAYPLDFGFGSIGTIRKKVDRIDEKVREEKERIRREEEEIAPEPLAISGLNVAVNQSAVISWQTNKDAAGAVYYGTTTAYGSDKSSDDKRKNHSFTLTELIPATTYYFMTTSRLGEEEVSETGNFVAKAPEEKGMAVKFNVTVPAGTASVNLAIVPFMSWDGTLEYVSMVDEGSGVFSATVELMENALVRYYYDKGSGDYPEDNNKEVFADEGIPLNYRYFHVISSTVTDTVANWTGELNVPPAGTIAGRVTGGGKGLMDATVSAAGVHAASLSDGSFVIENVPAGKQRVTVFTAQGEFKPYSNEVDVTSGLTANTGGFILESANKVNVTFNVNRPDDLPHDHKIRVAGNVYQLGSVQWFCNVLDAARTDRYFQLDEVAGSFSGTVELFEGTYVQYIYTLGGNHFGDERDDDIQFVFREFMVGDSDMVINDIIPEWSVPGLYNVTFNVTAPLNSPPDEPVYLVSGPATMMQQTGPNNWTLTFQTGDWEGWPGEYRFARGMNHVGNEEGSPVYTFNSGAYSSDQVVAHNISNWRWFTTGGYPEEYEFSAAPVSVEISTRPVFVGGVYFLDYWEPSFMTLLESSLDHLESASSAYTHIVLSAIRNFENIEEPKLQPRSLVSDVMTVDTPAGDIKQATELIAAKGKKVILYPQQNPEMTPGFAEGWFKGGDAQWVDNWKDEMLEFFKYSARICADNSIDTMVLGHLSHYNFTDHAAVNLWMNETVIPAIKNIAPHTKLIGTEYNLEGAIGKGYDWYGHNDIDYLGINIWKNLGLGSTNTVSVIKDAFDAYLDNEVKPAYTVFGKPVIATQFAYASAEGSANGAQLGNRDVDDPGVKLDLQEQARIFEAFFLSAADREWVGGILPFGYNFIDTPHDKDYSIRAKPAEAVTKEYYDRFGASVN